MPGPVSLSISAWAFWTPESEALIAGGALPAPRPLPMTLRRRVTPIGRKALECAWAVLPQDRPPRIVLSSRHGEYTRTFDLLKSLAEEGEVSPADFGLSVHHALAGLLSIATGNRSGHSAISAGADTFGYGLLEAAACVSEDQQDVLLLHFDESLPAAYLTCGATAEPSIAIALLLAPQSVHQDGVRLEMEMAAAPRGTGDGALAPVFLSLLTGTATDAAAIGDRMNWRWSCVA